MHRRIEGVVYFPSRLPCKADALEASLNIEIGGTKGVLVLPGPPRPPDDGPFRSWLSPPPVASPELTQGLPSDMWGYSGNAHRHLGPFSKVKAAVVQFHLLDSFDDEAVKERAKHIGDDYDRWLRLLWTWLQALNGMSYLDPNHNERRYQVQLRGLMNDGYGQANTTSINTTVITDLIPTSEETLQAAGSLASEDRNVPLEHRLLSEARSALLVGDRRQAILDAATAAELTLTDSVDRALSTSGLSVKAQSIVSKGFRMLGNRVRLAASLGISLPPKVKERLVESRNKVIHAGIEVAQKEAADAVSASAELVQALSPLDHYRDKGSSGSI